MSAGRPEGHYLLGHTENELSRLDVQDRLYRDITERAFREGGIESGMRVLDLGCGTGGVTLTAADIVGPEGEAIGLDRSPVGLEVGRRHAAEHGIEHARFVEGRIDDFFDPDGFDALVGRFVLMHQPDPAATLRAAARSLRPGGIAVFVESSMRCLESAHSEPHSPFYDEIVRWKSAVVGGAGADLAAGLRLRRTLLDAGLAEPVCRLEAPVTGGPDSPYYAYVAESVRSMLPEARRLGLEGFDARAAETVEARLRDEVVASAGVLVVWPVVAARALRP